MKTLAAIVFLCVLIPGPAAAQTLRVLVTNDDGIEAPGIAVLAEQLARNQNLAVTVIAPSQNMSATGENTTTDGTLSVSAAETAGGMRATAVSGFPADCVLYGVLEQMADWPDVVVSGINEGLNFADAVKYSGTVGAALTAARLGIPALAVSRGLHQDAAIPLDYSQPALYAAGIVEVFRTSPAFRWMMGGGCVSGSALVLNINFPSCPQGVVRGVRVVPLDRLSGVAGYSMVSETGGARIYQPVVKIKDHTLPPDCMSQLAGPATDYDAFMHGFVSVTPMAADMTISPYLSRFGFLERLAFR